MGEILADTAFLRKTLIEMRGDIRAPRFIAEFCMDPIHDLGRFIEISIVAECDIDSLAPNLRTENHTGTLVKVRPAAISHG